MTEEGGEGPGSLLVWNGLVAKVTRSGQLGGHDVPDDTTAANELESTYGRTRVPPGQDGNASADAQENSWPNWEKMLSALQKLVETGSDALASSPGPPSS